MSGEKGLVRSMSTVTLQGSIKMMIPPWNATNEGYVYILEYVAKRLP